MLGVSGLKGLPGGQALPWRRTAAVASTRFGQSQPDCHVRRTFNVKMSARCAKVSLKTGDREEKTFIALKPEAELRDFVADVGRWAGLKPGTVRMHYACRHPSLFDCVLFWCRIVHMQAERERERAPPGSI